MVTVVTEEVEVAVEEVLWEEEEEEVVSSKSRVS